MVSNALLNIAMRGQFDSQNMRRGVATLRLLVKPAEPEACNDDHVGVYLMRLLQLRNFRLIRSWDVTHLDWMTNKSERVTAAC
jgi:hypothetical protein